MKIVAKAEGAEAVSQSRRSERVTRTVRKLCLHIGVTFTLLLYGGHL